MKHDEHILQIAIHNLLNFAGVFHFAVPNGEYRTPRAGARLKAEGVMAGVSDLILVMPDSVVFVELKKEKGKQSPHQKYFQEKVESMGYTYLIWRNLKDCEDFIKKMQKK